MIKKERNIYLSNIDVEEAQSIFWSRLEQHFKTLTMEKIPVIYAQGRITAYPVFARLSSPNHNASAMDGIAVKASDTFSASEGNPLRLTKGKDFIYIDTGDPILEPFNAVIMIEDVVEIDEETVEILKAASPWQDIRPIGEDIVAREMIVPSHHEIRPVDIGALLSGGITEIEVLKKPRVGIIPTGTEIIEPGEPIEIGNIIESNSRVFEGLVKNYGGEPCRYSPVKDDYELLKSAIISGMEENDMLIINAGSSAGSEDFTVKLINELGEALVHGIATRPGKPTILGIIKDKPVIGIPGYPVSAYFVFETFAAPLIKKYLGQPFFEKPKTTAILSKRIVSSLKHREYVRMKLGSVGEKLVATPLNRGAGATMSLVRADGVLIIPQNSEGIEAGESIEVELLKDLRDIHRTIVSIGSHDLLMDMIGNQIHRLDSSFSLSSSHVGSLGGIMAVRREEAHMAPIHLLDEDTGVYNVSFIKRYLNGLDMVLVKGVKRVQGLIVQKGNPKNIQSIEDLLRNDVQFVNRQRGAGTRILTDFELKKRNIDVSQVLGYDREMTTHMAVAAAVSSGSADVGIGVYSAAQALELDFIPIGDEDYDFVIPMKYLEEEKVQLFLNVLRSEELKQQLEKMGGYRFENMGEIVYIR
ncbi:MAG: molybdopterin biosynthesis protein [Bacillota bacterium]